MILALVVGRSMDPSRARHPCPTCRLSRAGCPPPSPTSLHQHFQTNVVQSFTSFAILFNIFHKLQTKYIEPGASSATHHVRRHPSHLPFPLRLRPQGALPAHATPQSPRDPKLHRPPAILKRPAPTLRRRHSRRIAVNIDSLYRSSSSA